MKSIGHGPVLAIGFGISFWFWVAMLFVNLSTFVGALVGTFFALIYFHYSKKLNVNTRACGAYALGVAIALVINLLMNVSLRLSILAACIMLLGVVMMSIMIHYYKNGV